MQPLTPPSTLPGVQRNLPLPRRPGLPKRPEQGSASVLEETGGSPRSHTMPGGGKSFAGSGSAGRPVPEPLRSPRHRLPARHRLPTKHPKASLTFTWSRCLEPAFSSAAPHNPDIIPARSGRRLPANMGPGAAPGAGRRAAAPLPAGLRGGARGPGCRLLKKPASSSQPKLSQTSSLRPPSPTTGF